MIQPLCLARFVVRSLKHHRRVSGCSFETAKFKTPANVHILCCTVCGKQSISWSFESLEDVK